MIASNFINFTEKMFYCFAIERELQKGFCFKKCAVTKKNCFNRTNVNARDGVVELIEVCASNYWAAVVSENTFQREQKQLYKLISWRAGKIIELVAMKMWRISRTFYNFTREFREPQQVSRFPASFVTRA